MIGAVCATADFFGDTAPECVVGGDIGTRDGSREVYRHLSNAADRGDEAANVIADIVVKIA